ncbi:MAG TPA: selenium metabolism-associated LysR family transcriptional regulator [Syntrophobacteraceae bacterium]|jgi:DNA-binding transcriptional LysR family regulator|nr:selenium metabolism-associated LysR family transcriptional regulator [Syntrophobacteraceae bacterium]
MDIHRLEVFCRVIEMQSFTRAADAVFLTQPTVSEHIRALEEEVEEKLVDRLGREVLPTPAGKILYRYARNIIRLRNEAVQTLAKYKGNLAGHLTVGASTIPGTYILPRSIGTFKARYPTIRISLSISDSAGVVDQVVDGSLEIGLIGASWDDRRIILEEIFSDELVLAVYPEHPWAARRTVEIGELADQPFVLRERGSGTRRTMVHALETHGFNPSQLNIVAEMGTTEAVRQGIKARIGISILSSHAVDEDIQRGTLSQIEINGVFIKRPFYLVQRKNRQPSPLCTAFLKHLRSEAPSTDTPRKQ